MTKRAGTLITLMILLGTSGCSYIRSVLIPDDLNNLSGAGALFSDKDSRYHLETTSLEEVLTQHGFITPQPEAGAGKPRLFLTATDERQRNELQDRLIAASNQKCALYIRQLASSKSQTHVMWSGLAALLSGAASVVNPASTAKALAAGSTVSNTYDNLYSESYFQDMTINVISAGISKKREGIFLQFQEFRNKGLTEYTVHRAIADALTYHSACNVISGLETAGRATNQADAEKIAPQLARKAQ